MKYGVEMGPVVMIYIPRFVRISSSIRKLIGEIHRQQWDHISIFLFIQNKKSRLKMKYSLLRISYYPRKKKKS
jgi:hypothetical protein